MESQRHEPVARRRRASLSDWLGVALYALLMWWVLIPEYRRARYASEVQALRRRVEHRLSVLETLQQIRNLPER